jgi:membrane protease YdiL (CAAX protease family)
MTTAASRLRNCAEVALVMGALEFGIWIMGPLVVRDHSFIPHYWLLVLLCGVYILWLSPLVINRDPAAIRGWGWRGEPNLGPGRWKLAWRSYAGVTATIGVALIAAGWWRDPAILDRIVPGTFAVRLSGYLVWGTVQALIFFGFIHTRLRQAIPMPAGKGGPYAHQAAVGVATAMVFSAAHLPNWPLMGFTLAAGLIWSCLFYWRPNVWLLGLCHALLGTLLHQFIRIPMRIGYFYHEPHGYIMRTVVPGLADFIGHRF